MKLIRTKHVMGFFCLFTIPACLEANADVVARASHNFNGSYELFSYPAKPSEELGQAEAVAKQQYGLLLSEVKSPATMFMCLWRDTSHKDNNGGKPAEVFLSCNFAPENIETPKSLIKMAEIYNAVDRVNLTAKWKLENGSYQLSRFGVDISADRKSFRSQNMAAEIQEIQMIQDKITFPQSADEPFQFKLQAQLPSRRNTGDAPSDHVISFSVSGTAEPTPRWINY